MPLWLPEPDPRRLPRSPLVLVTCQLQYEERPILNDFGTVLAVHGALGGRDGRYPHIEIGVNQALNLAVGPSGTQQTFPQPSLVVRFRSRAGDWTISLTTDSVALETTSYDTWQDFGERLRQMLIGVCSDVQPTQERRLGLRYVNQITEPTTRTPVDWREYIRPELLGLPLHPYLGGSALLAQQQLLLDLGDSIRGGVRHGYFPLPERDGASTYLLDFDVFRDGERAVDLEGIMAACTTFNRLTTQLFQQSITPRLLEILAAER